MNFEGTSTGSAPDDVALILDPALGGPGVTAETHCAPILYDPSPGRGRPEGGPEEVRVVAVTTADLVAGVWFSLGYRPAESLLLAVLEGPRERMGLVVRADLPDPAVGAGPLRPLVRELFEGVHRLGATAVVAIVASEQALGGPGRKARAVLEREAQATGVRLRDVLGVTPTSFRSLRCSGPPCCPVGGRSIETVMTSRTAATYVGQGAVVAESEAALLADVRADPAHPEFPAGTGVVPPASGSDRLPAAERLAWWARWTEAYDAAAAEVPGDRPGLSRPSLIGLSAALRDGRLRDAVVFHLLGAGRRRVGQLLAGNGFEPAEPMADLDRLLRRPPDFDRLRSGEQVLAGCARAAPPGERSPALAVLALLAWYRGNGVRARLLVEEGTRDQWAVRWPVGENGCGDQEQDETGSPGDPGGSGPGEGDGVSLLDLVEGLLLRAGSPPWVSDRPDG